MAFEATKLLYCEHIDSSGYDRLSSAMEIHAKIDVS